MKEAKDVLRVVGVILLALFVLVVALPFVFTLLHIAVGFLVVLAISLIKVAIAVAIVYLIVVGIRAVLK
jgi:hypothetical protein